MNKSEFITAFLQCLNVEYVDELEFHLYPIEENKNYNSIDDIFRLSFTYPLEEMKKHKMTFEQVVKNLTWKRDIYPMWIDIYIDDEKTVYVYFSRRFRKYSEICMKKDRDIPPFKRIYNKFEIE